mmetsp:Transcript_57846/g.134752  ORF Transcript_57846/g.134752 Transcript_57846/m.134752 type:complete len:189 (-) Transcript_57846:114-680(-)
MAIRTNPCLHTIVGIVASFGVARTVLFTIAGCSSVGCSVSAMMGVHSRYPSFKPHLGMGTHPVYVASCKDRLLRSMRLFQQAGSGRDSESEWPRRLMAAAPLLLLTGYIQTLPETPRRLKVCVRSKEFIDDFMAKPANVAFLEKKGIPQENMRAYLQDPDCVSWSEWWSAVRPFDRNTAYDNGLPGRA